MDVPEVGPGSGMTPVTTPRLKQIFADVLEQPADRRASILDEACSSDFDLRKQIEALLAAHDQMGDYFARGSGASIAETSIAEGATLCGRYRIVRLLGHGGTGEVYEAFDQELSIFVALKVLAGVGTDTADHARFRREILISRQITHPNVCHVFDYHRDASTVSSSTEFISM